MRFVLSLMSMLACAAPALAQPAPAPALPSVPDTARDATGTGPYPAEQLTEPGLPDHVVYRPRDLGALGDRKLGLFVWGNGGCSDDGASARKHLAEIASHGYLVITPGRVLSGPGAPPQAQEHRAPSANGVLPPVKTTTAQVLAGVDWALAENERAGSLYHGRIDPQAVAVGGHSCGGLQAIEAGADPRIKTVLIHNSGVFKDGSNPIPGITVDKTMLRKLHTPVLYVLGGPKDIAFENGSDDVAKIDHVPVVLVSSDVGHGGTFAQPNGGKVAQIATEWLDWQLRGDAKAAKAFTGAHCGLCNEPGWTIERKGLE